MGSERREGVCHDGICSLQPATQILPARREVGVWGGRESLNFSARSFSHLWSFPASLQVHLFIFISQGLQFFLFFFLFYVVLRRCFFYWRHWGWGCIAVIYAGPGRFSRRGRGLGGHRLLLALADPRLLPAFRGQRILSFTQLPARQKPPPWRRTTPVLIPALEER